MRKRRSAQFILPVLALVFCSIVAVFFLNEAGNVQAVRAESPSRQSQDGFRIWYPAGRYPNLMLPDGESRAIHSVLNIKRSMRFGEYVWNDERIPQGTVWARVDLGNQTLSVFRGGHEIGTAVILYGAHEKPTPVGAFRILQKAEEYRSRTYDADMPYMLRLTEDGVALHASNVREGFATHGCIGLPLSFARRLFAQMQLGDLVVIVPAKT